jgi:hypothetical protein
MLVWEFNRRIEGIRDKEINEWKRTRWLGMMVLQPHMKKGQRLRANDILPLPDDAPLPKMSRESIDADVEKKKRILKRNLKERSN